ncbi:MAG: sulfatase-like hydrolase/transferase, partial [Verrucomicrobiota bacterium]
ANTGMMKREEFTLYEALKTKGYRTGHFGKWHMGTLTTKIKDANRGKPGDSKHYSAPWHHQVDECLVTESKTPTYDPMIFPTKRGSKKNGWYPVTDADGEDVGIYGTHYFTGEDEIVPVDSPKLKGDDSKIIVDYTIPFIRDAVEKKAPFFTIVWFHAPHLPCVAGPKHTKHYQDASEYFANYNGCITALDEHVGRLRAELRELGVAENTMVVFCSDNGPEGSAAKAPGSAADFRGRKRSLYEGGIRVPGLIEWPAKIDGGGSTDFPAGTVDYFPTIMAAAGFEVPDDRPMDGLDLMDVFAGKAESRSAPLAFQDRSQWALSDNRYKIYSKTKGKTWELYDLLEDRGETKDLAAEKPEIVQKMAAQFMEWRDSCALSDAGGDYD